MTPPSASNPQPDAKPEPGYAELHCLSAFSFQRGASSAAELFARAAELGYAALAITDECSLAGIVRAWQASNTHGVPLIVGSELQLADGPRLVLLVASAAGYRRLCQLITLGRRRMPKGQYRLENADLIGDNTGLLALWHPADLDPAAADATHHWLQTCFAQRVWLAVALHRGPDDAQHLAQRLALAQRLQLPAVAVGEVHMHVRARRALQDVLTAVRHHTTVAEAGQRLFPNGERHLRPPAVLASLYPPALLQETQRIAALIDFDLKRDLHYTYPHELVPAGHTPTSWLHELCATGARWRWPTGPTPAVLALIDKELAIIAELGYESYFLTVHDVVRFARERDILCQGRGSAANSAVCFVLGITELEPARSRMLFERFISRERKEPPDIDVDFEHERREEVLQYVFQRYGRARAALTAVATTYGGRGALREVARGLGLAPEAITRLTRSIGHWSDTLPPPERILEAGMDPASPLLARILALAGELLGMPHYLSQHPGGFVISEHPLHTLVPVENAAMEGRTVIQWDKDDLDALGLLKVDILALGMLSALRRSFALLATHRQRHLSIAHIPAEDPATYAMISRADTIGVFQIESRAQMAMLPRLQPRCFYDLVIEVAIVRPGPIQGDMVHPYLRRRKGEEPVDYPSPELQAVFERTLGVPLFQEQVMELAIVAAGYSPGEADQLRRSMAAWKRHGGLEPHRERITQGMLERGYSVDFAARIFEQIKGFGSYGFPESHAASFALLCYASAWLKCHEPAAFTCALLNSQPMGFYSVDQLLADARRHGIEIRPVDVRYSDWDSSLEPARRGEQPAIRMGLGLIRGFPATAAQDIQSARALQPFQDVADLCTRAQLDQRQRGLLADAGALKGLAGHRHRARWLVAGVEVQTPLLAAAPPRAEAQVQLPLPTRGEDLRADYALLGTTLGPHPLTLLRPQLRARRLLDSRQLQEVPHGRWASIAGLVTGRQRPQTASGVTFVTLEDEHGMVNVVVWRTLAERQRRVLVQSRLLWVRGTLERADGVMHLIAGRLEDLSNLLQGLDQRSRDFH